MIPQHCQQLIQKNIELLVQTPCFDERKIINKNLSQDDTGVGRPSNGKKGLTDLLLAAGYTPGFFVLPGQTIELGQCGPQYRNHEKVQSLGDHLVWLLGSRGRILDKKRVFSSQQTLVRWIKSIFDLGVVPEDIEYNLSVATIKNKPINELFDIFGHAYYDTMFPESTYQSEIVDGVRLRLGEVNICQIAPNEAVNSQRVREIFHKELFVHSTDDNYEPAIVPPVFAPYVDTNTHRQSMLIDGNNRTVALLCLQYLSHFGLSTDTKDVTDNTQKLIDKQYIHPKRKKTIIDCIISIPDNAQKQRNNNTSNYQYIKEINVIGAHTIEEFWPNINVAASEKKQTIILNDPSMLRTYTQDATNIVPPKGQTHGRFSGIAKNLYHVRIVSDI